MASSNQGRKHEHHAHETTKMARARLKAAEKIARAGWHCEAALASTCHKSLLDEPGKRRDATPRKTKTNKTILLIRVHEASGYKLRPQT